MKRTISLSFIFHCLALGLALGLQGQPAAGLEPAVKGASPRSPAASSTAASELPRDPRYWAFHEWYVNHSVLSVMVSGADLAHLEEVLREVKRAKDRRVIIGDVLIVGTAFDPAQGVPPQQLASLSREQIRLAERIKQLLRDNGLQAPRLVNAETIAQRFEVEHSPVWIVRHKGKNYVYEGLSSPSRLFSAQGVFHGR